MSVNVTSDQSAEIYLIKGLKLWILLESMNRNCMQFVVILKERVKKSLARLSIYIKENYISCSPLIWSEMGFQ